MSLQWKSNYWKLLLLTVSDNLLVFWVNGSDYNWFEITETKKYILKYKYKKEIAQRSAFMPNIRASLIQHFPNLSKSMIIHCK